MFYKTEHFYVSILGNFYKIISKWAIGLSWKGDNWNPVLNAGYGHVFCLKNIVATTNVHMSPNLLLQIQKTRD